MNPIVALLRSLGGFSFKEKSLLISLAALLVVYGGYFIGLLGEQVEPSLGAMLQAMLGLVVALVIVHVAYHVVISLDDVEESEDERDRAVRRRAAVLGYNVLFVAMLMVIGRMLILGARAEADPGAAAPDQFEVANLLLAGLVMSEIVYYGSQLYLYRRGFHD